jgi:hypothetical protein
MTSDRLQHLIYWVFLVLAVFESLYNKNPCTGTILKLIWRRYFWNKEQVNYQKFHWIVTDLDKNTYLMFFCAINYTTFKFGKFGICFQSVFGYLKFGNLLSETEFYRLTAQKKYDHHSIEIIHKCLRQQIRYYQRINKQSLLSLPLLSYWKGIKEKNRTDRERKYMVVRHICSILRRLLWFRQYA